MKAISWEASDGTRFDNEQECLNHEKSLLHCWDEEDMMVTEDENILYSATFMIIQKENVGRVNKIFHESDKLPDGGFSAGFWYFSDNRWYKLEDSEQFV